MRSITFAMLALFAVCDLHAASLIKVLKVHNEQPNTFDFGERCAFETTLPQDAPLRLRVIRGTKQRLISYARTDNARAGCIDYFSLLVRPIREGNDLDLDFYLDEGWLSPDGRANGQFVFIVERDDDPGAPVWEASRLRLPADAAKVATYFKAGVEVTVTRPRNVVVQPNRGSSSSSSLIADPNQACVDLDYDRRPASVMQAQGISLQGTQIAAGSQ